MDVDDRVSSDHDAAPALSDGDSEPEAPMVVSRARRSNAGNRMSTLLAKAAGEEEWGEEWEEAPNEEEFVGDETNEQDDYNLDSSSSSDDDDDAADDEAGEKELRKAERQERSKKRKIAANPFAARLAAAARKRVKLDVPSTTQSPAPGPARPKKKSERASWIPTEEDGPTRTSSRKQTIANKEHTLAKLKEKDRRRDDTLAMMKAAEARKAKDEPKPLTQTERLTEAARVERINSKSLHRWEEAEEQRAAERQAKLDALKNRQIEGPFIRYYSGPAIWVDDKIKYTGKDAPKLDELEEKLNKDMATLGSQGDQNVPIDCTPPKQQNPSSNSPVQTSQPGQPPQMTATLEDKTHTVPELQDGPKSISHPSTSQAPISNTEDLQGGAQTSNSVLTPHEGSASFLMGVEQYAQLHSQNLVEGDHSTPQSQPPLFVSQPELPPNPFLQNSHTDLSLTNPLFPEPPASEPQIPPAQLPRPLPPPPPPAPPKRKTIRRALRNLIILSSFPNLDATAAPTRARTTASLLKEKDKAALIQLSTALFDWSVPDATAFVTAMLNAPKTKREKEALAKPKKAVCAVSNKEARYRDPETGIAYRDSRAFGVLRGVVGGGFVWCGELGCYVGGRAKPMQSRGKGFLGMAPAAGVPKRFLEMEKKAAVAAVPPSLLPPPPPAVQVEPGEDGKTPPQKPVAAETMAGGASPAEAAPQAAAKTDKVASA